MAAVASVCCVRLCDSATLRDTVVVIGVDDDVIRVAVAVADPLPVGFSLEAAIVTMVEVGAEVGGGGLVESSLADAAKRPRLL